MIRALILSLLICTAVMAEGPVCRVVDTHPNGYQDMGTGTLVQQRYVMTCRHLFDDGVDQMWVYFEIDGTGFKALAEIVARDDLRDFTLLKLDRDVPCEPVTLGPPPKAGDKVEIRGWGVCPPWPGTWKSQWGTMFRVYMANDGCEEYELATCMARSGDSGGPIFDAKGRYVLCLWGCDLEMKDRIGPPHTFAHDPTDFLNKHLPKPAAKKSNYDLLHPVIGSTHVRGCY